MPAEDKGHNLMPKKHTKPKKKNDVVQICELADPATCTNSAIFPLDFCDGQYIMCGGNLRLEPVRECPYRAIYLLVRERGANHAC